MCTQWVEALQINGLLRVASSQQSFAAVEFDASEKAQILDLSTLSIVDITGEDAATFLQGQFCNDLNSASQGRAQITGYCTPKGRLLALPIVVGIEGGYRLLVTADVKESFLKRLQMFIMRSKVTISERSDWVCLGFVSGTAEGEAPINALIGNLPGDLMDATTTVSRQLIRWHDGGQAQCRSRFLVLASVDDQIELWKAAESMPCTSEALWRQFNILAGIPTVSFGIQEAFVPQMINLQLIDGLSFKKGCYPGQEIVARMHYLGKLKRHMQAFRCELNIDSTVVSAPLAGQKLQSSDSDAEAGVIVDAVINTHGQIDLLAVVKVSTSTDTLLLAGNKLTALDLPYDLPTLQASV